MFKGYNSSCIILFVINGLSADAYSESYFLNDDNYEKLNAFLNGDEIYDMGLYSNTETAILMMQLNFPEFRDLCEDNRTINSLRLVIIDEKDPYTKSLLIEWYEYLGGKLNKDVIQANNAIMSSSNYRSFNLRLPSGRTIIASRYIGSAAPEEYIGESQFSSARKVANASWYYNCHSYAWYYGGSTAGIRESSMICIDDPKGFYTSRTPPTCARPLSRSTPRAGDIAVYEACRCLPLQTYEIHSAIITNVAGSRDEYEKITVRSKWGRHGVYTHKLSDCPYYSASHNCQFSGKTKIHYYRIVHQWILSNGVYQCSLCGYSLPVSPFRFEEEL